MSAQSIMADTDEATTDSSEPYTLQMKEGWKIVFDPELNIFVVQRDKREMEVSADAPLPKLVTQKAMKLSNGKKEGLTVTEEVADALTLNLGIKSATQKTCFEKKLSNQRAGESSSHADTPRLRARPATIKSVRRRPLSLHCENSPIPINCSNDTPIVKRGNNIEKEEEEEEARPPTPSPIVSSDSEEDSSWPFALNSPPPVGRSLRDVTNINR